jgi:hypothetical protein
MGVRRRAWGAARQLGGALILAVVVWWVGPGPFLDGLRGLSSGAVLAALAIGVLTTSLSAWRWRVVAGALGVGLPFPEATAAYYRSQFLNSTLPGGVLGDVHRGLRHGADVGDLGRGLRAVVWERVAGQVVQVAVTVAVLLVLPSPVPTAVLAFAVIGIAAAGALALTGRGALLLPATLGPVVLASLLVVSGYVGMFLLAARAAGVDGELWELLPLALVVLLAAAIPVNVAGWGPREGAAAWVFASAGWGAAAGASVATAFGVLTLVSVLPGAVVLLAGRRGSGVPAPRSAPAVHLVHTGPREDGASHG